MGNYWSELNARRLNRRRLLASSAAVGGAAVLLAACGGGDDSAESEGPKDTSGLLTQPKDETSSLKRGGILKSITNNDIANMDPYLSNQDTLNRVYNQFFYIKGGHLAPSRGEIGGDLAESWEFSPDKLQLTIKLTDKAHFAPLPPVNGRAMDAQDVLFSYDRLKAIGSRRANLANDINPQAPVLSMSSPDARTVIVKFSEPLSTVNYLFANWTSVNLFIVPREAEDQSKLDLRRTYLGTGLWYLAEYTPSVRFVYKRNPGFGQDSRNVPYIDTVEQPIVSEYAAGLAQFRAGHIYTFTPTATSGVRGEDILPTKRSIPDLEMMATDVITSQYRVIYGWLPDSAFEDERVRQAFSMAIDRDLFIEVYGNTKEFEAEGLPMETRWNTSFQADTWEGWWLDPRGSNFGNNARFFKHDIAEAKRLLSAAGFPNGLDYESNYSISTGYGPAYNRSVELIQAMIPEAGFRPKINDIDYNTVFGDTYRAPGGKFTGNSFIQSYSAALEPVEYLSRFYGATGSDFRGFDADGRGNGAGDPVLEDLITKMKREFDDQKRQALVHDFQRHDAMKQYFSTFPGGANSFTLAWPAVRGRQVWRGEGQRVEATLWLDETKAPIKA